MVRSSVDQDDAMFPRESPAQVVSCHEPSSAASENDDVGGLGPAAARDRLPGGLRLRPRFRRCSVESRDGRRVAGLVELVLRKEDGAVWSDKDIAGHPAVGQLPEECSVGIRDHRTRQAEPRFPRVTRLHRFEGAHADDLEPLVREALEYAADGRSLLPTRQSLVLPEHDEHSICSGDRQTQVAQRNARPCRNACGCAIENFHLSPPFPICIARGRRVERPFR